MESQELKAVKLNGVTAGDMLDSADVHGTDIISDQDRNRLMPGINEQS